jgi:hypothetical protein
MSKMSELSAEEEQKKRQKEFEEAEKKGYFESAESLGNCAVCEKRIDAVFGETVRADIHRMEMVYGGEYDEKITKELYHLNCWDEMKKKGVEK